MIRELCDLAVRAFVSFVRFYYKHECQLIFRPKCKMQRTFIFSSHSYKCLYFVSSVFVPVLDLPRLAGGTYALLQLPKMPELKHCDTSSFTPHALTLNDVPYKTTPQPKQTPGTYHVCMHEFSITHTLLTGQVCADLVILDSTGFSCTLPLVIT